jgi:HNH endonuclease
MGLFKPPEELKGFTPCNPPEVPFPEWWNDFWSRVYRLSRDPRKCQFWTGPFDGDGYGMFSHQSFRFGRHPMYGKRTAAMRAHRFIWEYEMGPIIGGLVLLHLCDTPQCVNTLHLRPGTIQCNMNDRNSKGRQARGETSARAVLSEADVLEIRSSTEHPTDMAGRLGVTPSTIINIRARRSWRHI